MKIFGESFMKHVNVAVVGATGLVGEKMLAILEERQFPVERLLPIASANSAGKSLKFKNQSIPVQPLNETIFEKVEIALFSAGATISKEFAKIAASAGVTVIDNSSAWRMHPQVPLVVPEVNPQALKEHPGIIANPNCSTIQMVVALFPLHQQYKIRRIVVSTYQAVTGSGRSALQQLTDEINKGSSEASAYPHPIAYNCLPHIDTFREDGYTREEQKMIDETRKIINDNALRIAPTCVRVPVYAGHSESINVEFEKPFDLSEIYAILNSAPGVVVMDDPQRDNYPMPIYAQDKDDVFVGRIRSDPTVANGLNLWVVSDNLRKGAATNAVQIAELLLQMEED